MNWKSVVTLLRAAAVLIGLVAKPKPGPDVTPLPPPPKVPKI